MRKLLNPVVPNAPFFYPWKYQKAIRFSDVFMGWRKGALGTNGLSMIYLQIYFEYCSGVDYFLLIIKIRDTIFSFSFPLSTTDFEEISNLSRILNHVYKCFDKNIICVAFYSVVLLKWGTWGESFLTGHCYWEKRFCSKQNWRNQKIVKNHPNKIVFFA